MEEVVNLWRARRVFLTGHTGFKGGWLALWLAQRGARVCGFALDPDSEPNLFAAASVASVVERDLRGDIRNFEQVESALKDFAPEVVLHLAAQPLVRRSYADPLATYATNVMGTAHILEAVRRTPSVRAVVCVTTDKCYENREWVWPYRETDPMGGHDPYSSSKACAEIISAAYRSSYFCGQGEEHRVEIATARAGNVIGGGDWSEDRLIPDLIRGFQAGVAVLIRRPNAVRPWQHVLEPAYGYMLLAEHLLLHPERFASSFNFGPMEDDAWPVEKIANRLVGMWGQGAAWTRDADPGLHEAHQLRLDASKARTELGWRPRLRIEQALEWTCSWYAQWARGADMHEVTRTQIAQYESLGGN